MKLKLTKEHSMAEANNSPAPNAINAAIEAAQAAAAQQANAPAGTQVATTGAAATPAAYVKPGKAMTMEDLAGPSINVDTWLKVKYFGLLVGDDITFFDKMTVAIDMTDGSGFVPKMAIKFGSPNTTYKNSYDGVSCVGGGSWQEALELARRVDPKAKPYRSVDIPMVLLEDLTKKDGSKFNAGTILGHSTSTTNWRHWESFYKACVEQGLLNKKVKVELGCEPIKKGQNEWGVVTFKLLGAHN
jgi:hypothetical protein